MFGNTENKIEKYSKNIQSQIDYLKDQVNKFKFEIDLLKEYLKVERVEYPEALPFGKVYLTKKMERK